MIENNLPHGGISPMSQRGQASYTAATDERVPEPHADGKGGSGMKSGANRDTVS